jgi:UDP-4-amino-4,6-dideoxy-N-acetyl-beta-L-altrosamine transaminase|tara:strand:- start:4356 stop:5489 length:1134 start_codon:yes stop_codon:yes gene_type:complete
MIPYSKQSISKEDARAVLKVLQSNFLTQGPLVEKFENKVNKFCGSKYSVAVNSGSSALHIACLALGVKNGDLVWTVPNTFVASANCAINCGAKIDFVDIDKDTFNISTAALEKKLLLAKKRKKLPKVLIPVHLGGQPTEQKKIWELSKKYKFKILEDASHSIGAKHFGVKVGSNKWADITVFSFHPVKIITTGEGGVATTKSSIYYNKMKIFRDNGIKRLSNNWRYEHISVGFNYRMTDIAASLGISQLKKINKFLIKRNDIAKKYKKLLNSLPIKIQKILPGNYSSYHLFIIQFDLKNLKLTYEKIFKIFRKNKYYVNLHYAPLHLSPYFRKIGFKKGYFPVSEKYGASSISIPIYYDLKLKDQFNVVNLIKRILC